jgi:hypothetical protein
MPDDFGVDWGISYISDLLVPDGNNVILVSPNMRSDMFVATPTPGKYLSPIQFYDQLTINGAGDFERREPDGTVNTYRGFADAAIPGRLTRIEDRHGNFMTFHYAQIDPDDSVAGDEKHVLAFVIDVMGREIRYQYYASTAQTVDGRPLTVVHPDGTAALGAGWPPSSTSKVIWPSTARPLRKISLARRTTAPGDSTTTTKPT